MDFFAPSASQKKLDLMFFKFNVNYCNEKKTRPQSTFEDILG